MAVTFLALAGCRGAGTPASERAPSANPPPMDDRRIILCLGTSLTAGDGLDPNQAWPAIVQDRLDAGRQRYRVVNAGVSGETSAGALHRIDWLMRQPVFVLVVETGANDGLRGQDPSALRANIQGIFDRANQQSPPPRLVLAGMRALTNYGTDYASRFRAVFPELAQKNAACLVPFLLDGVAGVPELNLPDGVHPNAAGQQRVAEHVLAALLPVLVVQRR